MSVIKLDRFDLDVLAQAASFGEISVEDLAPSPRTVARVSRTLRKRQATARVRIAILVECQLIHEHRSGHFAPTALGYIVLADAGYERVQNGSYLIPGKARPGWAS